MERFVFLNNLPSFIDSVQIKGFKKTNDKYIEQAINNVFNCTNFFEIVIRSEELRSRLYNLGCFKSVDILIDASKDKKSCYDVIYNVQELAWISGGIHTSVGNNEGSLNATISFPNLFGNGEKLTAEYSIGTRYNNDYRFTYQTPLRLNVDKIFSVSAFKTSNEYPWSKFKQNDTGICLNITSAFRYTFFDKYIVNGKHDFSYETIWRNLISSFDSAFRIREESGHSLKSALRYSCVIDRRTSQLLPNDGGYSKGTIEIAGVGGDVNYLKATEDYQYTKTLFKHIVLQFTLSGGVLVPLGRDKKIAVSDKFFLGGPLGLRGFQMRGAGPHEDDCSLGNSAYWLIGAHIYTPLPFFQNEEKLTSWFKTHSFVNVGNLLALNDITSFNKRSLENLTSNARLSVGTGIVMRLSEAARIELNYVWPLWKQPSDKVINGLQFGIGIFFN